MRTSKLETIEIIWRDIRESRTRTWLNGSVRLKVERYPLIRYASCADGTGFGISSHPTTAMFTVETRCQGQDTMKTVQNGKRPSSGRRRAQESRGTEFRRKLIEWKQTPDSSRPSLRAVARELGTSHQLLAFYLEGLEKRQAEECFPGGEGNSRTRLFRGPGPDTMGRAAGPCLQQGRRPCHGRSDVPRHDRAYKAGGRKPPAGLAGNKSAEDPRSWISALAERIA